MTKLGIITRVLREKPKETLRDYTKNIQYIEFEKGKDYDVCCTDSKASQKASCNRLQAHESNAASSL